MFNILENKKNLFRYEGDMLLKKNVSLLMAI